MDYDRNAANYFTTMAFFTGAPEDFFYDLGHCDESELPLAIRAFLTEWRKYGTRARAGWCLQLDDESGVGDLFNTIDYCIDQILRRIVPTYERIERRRREKRRRYRRRRRQRAAKDRGDVQTQTRR